MFTSSVLKKRNMRISVIFIVLIAIIAFISLEKDDVYSAEVVVSGTSGSCGWTIDSDGALTIYQGELGDPSWLDYKQIIKRVYTEGPIVVTSGASLFSQCDSLVSADLSGFDTSNTTDMSDMFFVCESLKDINMTGWDTSNVQNTSQMFLACESLETLDLSEFDTSSNTNMYRMFSYCTSLKSVDVSKLITSKVQNMSDVFWKCEQLEKLDLSSWDTSSATDMGGMFMECFKLKELNLGDWDTSNVTMLNGMFEACLCLDSVDTSNWNTSKVTNFGGLFCACVSMKSIDVSGFDTSNADTLSRMFYNCSSLQEIDVTGFDTSKVENAGGMFERCSSLTELDLSSFDFSNIIVYEDPLNDFLYTGLDGGIMADCKSLQTLKMGKYSTCNAKAKIYFPVPMRDMSTGKAYNSKAEVPRLDYRTYSRIVPVVQNLTVKSSKKTVSKKALKTRSKTVKPILVKGAKGEVSYTIIGGDKKSKKALRINKNTGKITVKKKTKKGSYKIKVQVTAAGTFEFKPVSRTVTVHIKVR